jgi:LmbE family N-acetylglucosaminyl deacetylase
MAVTWQHDPHCDHQAAFTLALSACRLMGAVRLFMYPIWGFKLASDQALDMETPQGFRLHMEEHLPAKRRAIAAHRSQVTHIIDDDPGGFILSADDIARFQRPFETYLSVGQ